MRGSQPRLFVFGIDGGDWHVIDALVARGRLPNLARFRHEAAHAALACTQPAHTAPELAIVASEYGFHMPDSIPAGLVHITLRNAGKGPEAVAVKRSVRSSVDKARRSVELMAEAAGDVQRASFDAVRGAVSKVKPRKRT